MRSIGRLLLTAAVCVPLLALGAPTASAAVLEASGWWWRLQRGLVVDLPPPSYVPEGGLYVAGAPDGPTAVSAVRFRVGEDEVDPVLTLQVAEDRGGEAAVVRACINTVTWTPTQAGVWDDRPEHACEQGSADGVRSDDGASWTFALGALVRDGRIDVTITAGELPDGGGWSTFELAFEPVDHGSVTSSPPASDTGGPSTDSHPDEPPTYFPPADDAGDPGAPGDGGTGSDVGAGGFSPAPGEAYAPESFTAQEPQTAGESDVDEDVPDPLVADDDEPDVPGASPVAPPPGTEAQTPSAAADRRADQGLGLLLVALCAGAGMVFAGDRTRPPQPLGRFSRQGAAPPNVRGIGRFARPRDGRPPRLL